MAYTTDNYNPHKKSRAILARAWEHCEGVPYKVTARWLFYRLLQEGHYSKKSDYDNRFLPLLSRARHNFFENWQPDSLDDDRRSPIMRGNGHETPQEWATSRAQNVHCTLGKWFDQEHYVEIWFEAGAMKSQFKHYTSGVTLRPFYGMPSIPYKWEIAKGLEWASQFYGKPIIVLYFGDLDPAGDIIPTTSTADIRQWCDVGFYFERAGLNAGDEVRYNIPENFEHPGAYQWEALEDNAARELITGAVEKWVDYDAMAKVEAIEKKATDKFRRYVERFRL